MTPLEGKPHMRRDQPHCDKVGLRAEAHIGRTDSARRTLGCLYGLEQDGDPQYPLVPIRVSVASTGQALASGLLIFLFLLAVRNLLRLK